MALLNINRHRSAHLIGGLQTYTTTTLPPVGGPGSLIYVSDANSLGGSPEVFAGGIFYSDGTTWRDISIAPPPPLPLFGTIFVDTDLSSSTVSPSAEVVQLGSDRVFEMTDYDADGPTFSTFAKVRLINVQDVNLGTRATLDTVRPFRSTGATLIDTDKVLTCFDDNASANQLRACVATISGQTITPGTAVDLGTLVVPTAGLELGQVSTDLALIVLGDSSPISTVAHSITVSGTVPELGDSTAIDGSQLPTSAVMVKMDDGRHLYGYSFTPVTNQTRLVSISVGAGSPFTVTRDSTQLWYSGSPNRLLYDMVNAENDIFLILYKVSTTTDIVLHPVRWTGSDVLTDGTGLTITTENLDVHNAKMTYMGNNEVFVVWSSTDQNMYGQMFQVNGLTAPSAISSQYTISTPATTSGLPLVQSLGDRAYISWVETGGANSFDRRVVIANP